MLLSSETFARYHRMGFSPRPVRGKGSDQDLAVSYYFENVQYVLNDYGAYEEMSDTEDMQMIISNLESIINTERHDRVKAVLDHIYSQLRVPLWCEIAMDEQLGVTFGCSEGSIAEMIMDFPTPEKFEEYKKKMTEQLKTLVPGKNLDELNNIKDIDTFIVIAADSKYDVVLKDLNVDGVMVENMDDDNFFTIDIDMDGDDDDDDEEE